jgi:protein TonB
MGMALANKAWISMGLVAVLLIPTAAASQNWVTDKGYPKEALRKGHEGIVKFTVDVTAEGKAENCRIIGSSGWPELDEATCTELVKRAHFKPATDSQGEPTRGTFTNSFRWVIPR